MLERSPFQNLKFLLSRPLFSHFFSSCTESSSAVLCCCAGATGGFLSFVPAFPSRTERVTSAFEIEVPFFMPFMPIFLSKFFFSRNSSLIDRQIAKLHHWPSSNFIARLILSGFMSLLTFQPPADPAIDPELPRPRIPVTPPRSKIPRTELPLPVLCNQISPGSAFPSFANLPNSIRAEIWKQALDRDPQVFFIYKKCDECRRNVWDFRYFVRYSGEHRSNHITAISSVCSEAYMLAREQYLPWVVNEITWLQFNPDKDIIYLESCDAGFFLDFALRFEDVAMKLGAMAFQVAGFHDESILNGAPETRILEGLRFYPKIHILVLVWDIIPSPENTWLLPGEVSITFELLQRKWPLWRISSPRLLYSKTHDLRLTYSGFPEKAFQIWATLSNTGRQEGSIINESEKMEDVVGGPAEIPILFERVQGFS